MKKILLLAAFLVAGAATAQITPQVSDAQLLEVSKEIAAEQKKLDAKVDKEVSAIMKTNGVAPNRKAELTELVMEKEVLIVRLGREKLEATAHKARVDAIMKGYNIKLKELLKK